MTRKEKTGKIRKTFIISTIMAFPFTVLATMPSEATPNIPLSYSSSTANTTKNSSEDPVPLAPAPNTAVGTTTLPYNLTIKGESGVASIPLSLTEGAIPVQFTGNIVANYNYPGIIEITVNGRKTASVNAMTGGPVSFPLTAADIDKGVITITMTVKLNSTENCFADSNATATLKNGTLSYSYPTTGPATIGTFLSEGITSYTVVVPKNPTQQETQAGLDAVAALTYRYVSPTKIKLIATDDIPTHDYLNRVIQIYQNSDNNNTMTVGKTGTMVINGKAETLTPAAIALADKNTDLLQKTTATSVSASPNFLKTSQLSLEKLGNAPVSLVGIGQQQTILSVNQPMFGQQINEMTVHIKGANTPLPKNSEGRIDFLWNGILTKSINMSDGIAIDETLTFKAADLQRDNGLTIMMSYVPATNICSLPSLPARTDINIKQSTVTVKAGEGIPAGFQRFPQAFEGVIPVAFDNTTQITQDSIANAGNLVASVQSAGNQQLVTQVIDEQTFEKNGKNGILVNADNSISKKLQAPITSNGNTAIGPNGEDFQAVTGAFGSLQAFNENGRDIVILSGIAPISAEQSVADKRATTLATYVNTDPNRWSTLSGQGLLLGDSGTPVIVDIPAPVPQTTKTSTFLIVGAIVLAVMIIGLLIWLWKRPKGSPPPLPSVGVADE